MTDELKPEPSDLDALEAQTRAVDLATATDLDVAEAAGQGAEPAGTNYATEAKATVDTFAALITGYSPKTVDLWDQATKDRIAAALAPVMEKYAFTLGSMPPELTLAIVAGPVLYQSARIIGEDIAQKKIAAARQRGQATDKPAAPQRPNEAPEVKRHPQEALYQ